jgi:hypothetical protein
MRRQRGGSRDGIETAAELVAGSGRAVVGRSARASWAFGCLGKLSNVDVDGLGLTRKRTSVRDAETGMPAPTQVPECLANFKVDKCFDCAGATPLRPGRAACLVWMR